MDFDAWAFGKQWLQARDYGNRSAASQSGMNGFGWRNSFVPTLTLDFSGDVDQATFTVNNTQAYYFKRDSSHGSSWYSDFYYNDTISLIGPSPMGEYAVSPQGGRRYMFRDLGAEFNHRTQYIEADEPSGRKTKVDWDTSGQRITSIKRDDSSTPKTQIDYTYMGDSDLVASATMWLDGHDVIRALYTYYVSGESGGSLGDVKTVVIQRKSPGDEDWRSIRQSFLRYYVNGEVKGFEHGLKLVLGPEAYARFSRATGGSDPNAASDESLRAYADYYFEYDSSHRVVLEKIKGGAYDYRFEYATNPNPLPTASSSSSASSGSASSDHWAPPASGDFNRWVTRTTVTQPDNSQEIVYCNQFGQAMLKILRSHEGEWCRYWRFDNEGRVVLYGEPSAVARYDERLSYLVQLYASQGLVQLNDYYSSTVDHGAPGRLRSSRVRNGEFADEAILRKVEYTPAHSVGGTDYFYILNDIRYVGPEGSDYTATTSYEYEWHTGDAARVVAKRTTKLPIVSSSQNGSGELNTIVEVYNENRYRTSREDERSVKQTWQWWEEVGAMKRHVMDADGLALTTDFEHDDLGRITQSLGPVHTVDLSGTATAIRRAIRTAYTEFSIDPLHSLYDSEFGSEEMRSMGYITSGNFFVIYPMTSTFADRAGRVIQRLNIGNSGNCRWERRFYDDQSHMVAERVYHHIPAEGDGVEGFDYAETRFGYDLMGRRNRTLSPAGTIVRGVFDSRGFLVETWVGTSDVGGSAYDPAGGGTEGNNMIQVEAREYDRGISGANGLLTQIIAFTGSGARVSSFDYDYRKRRILARGENGFRETYVVDNLGRVTLTERWNDEGVSPLLVARNAVLYDDLGRVYRTVRYAIDPQTGAVGVSLAEDTWFDPVGNVMKRRNPEDAGFEKLTYDGPGRLIHRYAGYNSVTPSYSEAESIDDDVIFEQSDFIYDAASNLIEEVRKERFHNAAGFGELRGPTGAQPWARVLFTMHYPDPIGRVIASANYGTYHGDVPDRPATIPNRSDSILVTSFDFNGRGEMFLATDPSGTHTFQVFDDAGRLIKVVENYQP